MNMLCSLCRQPIKVLTEDTFQGDYELVQFEYLACSNEDCLNYDPSNLLVNHHEYV